MKDIRQEIIELLRERVPESLMPEVDEIESLIMNEEYRPAFSKMDDMKRNPLWAPTSRYIELMELFWCEYAQ